MVRADYRKAIDKAKEVLKQNSFDTPPISPREIANSCGIEVSNVIFRLHKEVAGFFDFKKNKIYVNHEEPYNRQTFTIAHELGHYFLHKELFDKHPEKYQVLLRKPMGAVVDPLEQEANAFAAELLVPKHLLQEYNKSPVSVKLLATIFVVSEDVIRYRLKTIAQSA